MCPARVALYGLGPIGKAVGRLALSRANLEVVGGIDTDPRMAGLDLGQCLGVDETLGTVVTADADAFLAEAQPDVVLHCTQSSLDVVLPQIERIIRHGACAVSTCEELAFPWRAENPELVGLDQRARSRGVAVLGTGINPGYAMDAVPLMLSAASQRVDHVQVERVQDAGLRRLPLMLKVGVGITLEEFEERRATIGHIGLPESLYLVADGLGWELDRTERSLEPMVSDTAAVFGEISVVPGAVLGVHETVRGFVADAERIVLDLHMYAGAPDPHDAVEIRGVPDLSLRIDGLHGDLGTAAVAVNAVAAVMRARPGVLTMRDMPLVSAFAGDIETRLVAREGKASD